MITTTSDQGFILNTRDTSYILGINPTGQINHIYYGEKITADAVGNLIRPHEYISGCASAYDDEHSAITLCNQAFEFSTLGKGDNREPFLELETEDGCLTSDFVYDSYCIDDICPGEENGLPKAYDLKGDNHLTLTLKDKNSGVTLMLHYFVFEEENVIVRGARLCNTTSENLKVNRFLSMLIDVEGTGYKVSSFTGNWTNEMNKNEVNLSAGKYVLESRLGSSSNTCNPFFMVAQQTATEDMGAVYGFNLIYSGNHYEAIEVSSYNMTRITSGINPYGFSYTLKPEEVFDAPQAVLTFSNAGYQKISENMHPFVRTHIVRGNYKNQLRPVLLNSWEANYFNISERKLVKLAKASAKVGIEILVMDDGWFGHRNDDRTSLGDWYVNKKKLPGGIKRLAKKVNKKGVGLGIWVEPEMISEDSDLYRKHPDWAMRHTNKNHSKGRNQLLLDLCNPAVVEYMIKAMSDVFSEGNIAYVKWDYNRNFTDFFSPYLQQNNIDQTECGHRYILGFYRLLSTLAGTFSDILFEGCASGGNRFDLGMLSYFPQIWASDNTDAYSRLDIQYGYSFGYPQSTYTAHVSDSPNHQTLRKSSLDTRFAVAAGCVLGYELNLCECSKATLKEIKKQVEFYKTNRQVLQYGQLYRTSHGNEEQWNVVSSDKEVFVATVVQRQTKASKEDMTLKVKGLEKTDRYRVTQDKKEFNLLEFGSLVNAVAPVHVKSGGLLHRLLAVFIKMPAEQIDETVYADALMSRGLPLPQAFVGTGYNENTRYMGDGSSRMYVARRVK